MPPPLAGAFLLSSAKMVYMAEEKVKGPASYFPSIEKTYGFPVSHWFELLDTVANLKHMEQVDWLKANHGLGHGHANALVAYRKAKSQD